MSWATEVLLDRHRELALSMLVRQRRDPKYGSQFLFTLTRELSKLHGWGERWAVDGHNISWLASRAQWHVKKAMVDELG
jgi:hypothetical protein